MSVVLIVYRMQLMEYDMSFVSVVLVVALSFPTRGETMSVAHFDNASLGSGCPTWMHLRNESSKECVCGVSHHRAVLCDSTLKQVSVLDSYVMTLDPDSQEAIVGHSIYGCLTRLGSGKTYIQVPPVRWKLDDVMCGPFNRSGRLCGACKEGYSPLVYSYQVHCVNCSNLANRHNWLRFTVVSFAPLTLFYFFIVLFKFNANSPSMHGFVFLAQVASQTFGSKTAAVQVKGHSPGFVVFLQTVYGVWNLDFFRALYPDICLNITTMQALSLNYLAAFYPLLLIIVTYIFVSLYSNGNRLITWIWRPFRSCLLHFRSHWGVESSLIDVFATILLLSYNKLLDLSFSLLLYTVPFNSLDHSVGKYLYFDGSKEYFGKEHLPYGILAVFVIFLFNFLPFLLLLLYPMRWFQRCLNHLPTSCVYLHTFVDSFAGYYKDGTETETRDCRYFAAFFLLLRALNYIAFAVTMTALYFVVFSIVLVCFTAAFVLARPYKQKYSHHMVTTTLMLMVFIILCCCGMGVSVAAVKMPQSLDPLLYVVFFMLLIPLVYITCLVLLWLYCHTQCKRLFALFFRGGTLNRLSSQVSLFSPSALKHNFYGGVDSN